MNTLIGRPRSIGLAGGAVWLIAASATFATWSLIAIGTPAATRALIGVLVLAATLIVTGVVVIRAALHLPGATPPRTPERRAIGRRFAGVVALEVAAFVLVNGVASVARQFELIPSLDLMIVGLHFLPLARIFRVPRYYVMGALFCAIPTVTLLSIPAHTLIGQALSWYVAPSLGCGFVATLTGAASLREAWQSVVSLRPSWTRT